MSRLRSDDTLARTLYAAIRTGDIASLKQLLSEHPALVSAMVGEAGKLRTPLHFATDWPGHFPNGAAVVAALIDAGADPNVRCEGARYAETPLHRVASTDDIEVFEVLIKAGADIEAPGGSIGDGTPLDNGVGYGQWQVARRLIECGARTKLWHVAALGLMSRVEAYFTADQPPPSHQITEGFLSSMRRRSATDREIPSRPWRRYQLDSAMGRKHVLGSCSKAEQRGPSAANGGPSRVADQPRSKSCWRPLTEDDRALWRRRYLLAPVSLIGPS
jgi:uncharacterized protein